MTIVTSRLVSVSVNSFQISRRVSFLISHLKTVLRPFRRHKAEARNRELLGYRLDDFQLGYRFFPKTACTSIKQFLFESEKGRPFEKRGENFQYNHIHTWVTRNRVQDISQCSIRITVIRDPVKRFISAYGDRVLAMGQLDKGFISKRHPELLDHFTKFRPTLSEFVADFDFYKKTNAIRHHTKPVHFFLDGFDLNAFTHVYKFEDLNKAADHFRRVLGTSVDLKHFKSNRYKVHFSDLSEKELEFLIDYYTDDYELMDRFYTPNTLREEWSKARERKD